MWRRQARCHKQYLQAAIQAFSDVSMSCEGHTGCLEAEIFLLETNLGYTGDKAAT